MVLVGAIGNGSSSAIIGALILVPIFLLVGITYSAVACSEFWNKKTCLKRCNCKGTGAVRHKRSRSDPPKKWPQTDLDLESGAYELEGQQDLNIAEERA